MSFFRTSQPVHAPIYTGLQIQTSSGAVPIPIVWGIAKIAPNILWNGDFQAHYSGGKGGGGGKGGSGSGKGNAGPSSYSTAIILGLCEGPINGVSAVWTNSTISPLNLVRSMWSPALYTGTTPQTTWSFLSTVFPNQAISYPGTAYIADYKIWMGSGATLNSYGFEIAGGLANSGFNGNDADPAQIIQDFLTNAQYGVGFPAASIDASTLLGSSGDASYQTYCKAAGLALSPALINREAANAILTRWLDLTNAAAVWSDGVLKIIPYGDAAISGALYSGGGIGFGTTAASQSYSYVGTPKTQTGSCTFNPNLTPVYDLTDDDFVAKDGADPVEVERNDPYSVFNMQVLEISQRTNFYDATPITVFDQSMIERYGLRIAPTVTAHEICDPQVAQIAGQLMLQRRLYVRNHYSFKLSWEYCLVEPMDLVTIMDSNLGLDHTVVRVTQVEESDDGILTITAEEFPAGVATATAYSVQSPSGGGIATNYSASSVN